MSWEDTAQNLLTQYGTAAIDNQFYQPYKIASMQIAALGQNGYYGEGQPGVYAGTTSTGSFVLSPLLLILLLGGAFILLKD